MSSEGGDDLLFIYTLADRLHKTVDEILQISIHEREGWLAYFAYLTERAKLDGSKRHI